MPSAAARCPATPSWALSPALRRFHPQADLCQRRCQHEGPLQRSPLGQGILADSVKDSYKAGLEIIALNRNELLQDVLSALADIRVPIYAMTPVR